MSRNDNTPQANPYYLACADLQWQPGDIPLASSYDDIYFSREQGLEETEYVFLEHNQLQQRWQDLPAAEQRPAAGQRRATFTIGETGFGTGLNFLAAWRLWKITAPPGWQLRFISTEKHPLQPDNLSRSLAVWPELEPLARQLIARYPVLVPGHHTLNFEGGDVSLHLLLGEASHGLEQLCAGQQPEHALNHHWHVDAWFLDGFAPAKNPSLWNDQLYQLLARLSHKGTTLATFTAVGEVRRGLARSGFTMKKVKGFGSKREMLCGYFEAESQHPQQDTSTQDFATTTPYPHKPKGVRAPWHHNAAGNSKPIEHVAVIGGGLAGAHSAHALARRGISVTLIESAAQIATGASGNPQGMLYTKLSPQAGLLNQFTLNSYLYALRHYRELDTAAQYRAEPSPINFCGVLQLASTDKDIKLLNELRSTFAATPELVQFCDAQQATALAGIPIAHAGWFYPGAGWVEPQRLCQQLCHHPLITLVTNSKVDQLAPDHDNQWQLLNSGGERIVSAQAVIVANSRDAQHFSQCAHLPLKTIRGQITELSATANSSQLSTVICHEGYLTPAIQGHHHLGATFDLNDSDTSLRPQDHRRNLDSLHKALPDLFGDHADVESLGGRAGLRCTSPDYMPIAGPAPNYPKFLQDYAVLRKNAHAALATTGDYHPRLYLNIAHGSRGLTSTPLCAELLAAAINQEPPPLGRDLQQALNPARFIIRDLIRNKI